MEKVRQKHSADDLDAVAEASANSSAVVLPKITFAGSNKQNDKVTAKEVPINAAVTRSTSPNTLKQQIGTTIEAMPPPTAQIEVVYLYINKNVTFLFFLPCKRFQHLIKSLQFFRLHSFPMMNTMES